MRKKKETLQAFVDDVAWCEWEFRSEEPGHTVSKTIGVFILTGVQYCLTTPHPVSVILSNVLDEMSLELKHAICRYPSWGAIVSVLVTPHMVSVMLWNVP